MLAHTGTVGRHATNRLLAQRRAAAVVEALVSEGGVARSRVFVSMLPETLLPAVTTQEVERTAQCC